MKELKKGESFRRGYLTGYAEAEWKHLREKRIKVWITTMVLLKDKNKYLTITCDKKDRKFLEGKVILAEIIIKK